MLDGVLHFCNLLVQLLLCAALQASTALLVVCVHKQCGGSMEPAYCALLTSQLREDRPTPPQGIVLLHALLAEDNQLTAL